MSTSKMTWRNKQLTKEFLNPCKFFSKIHIENALYSSYFVLTFKTDSFYLFIGFTYFKVRVTEQQRDTETFHNAGSLPEWPQ